MRVANPIRLTAGTAALFTLLGMLLALSPSALAQQTVGLTLNDYEQTFDGYTLVTPLQAPKTFLIDNGGLVVNEWTSSAPANIGYLRPNGNLVRTAGTTIDPNFAGANGSHGKIEEYDWDGSLVWEYTLSDAQFVLHHDIFIMPNGNILAMVWEFISDTDAIANGRDPATIAGTSLIPDKLIEIEPTPPVGGNVVWEWRAWDHIVQDFDNAQANFGVIADHPELINLNFDTQAGDKDWTHCNGIDYNPSLDQVVVSCRHLHEIWIVDHSTTTAEAAGSTGGTWGKGGDLLYRYGNPQIYDRGLPTDQVLFFQHDSQWIDAGRPGAGNLIIYNNGPTPAGNISSADEIVPPTDMSGNYVITDPDPYGPAAPVWQYTSTPPEDFYSVVMSGAERQPNGNTLITEAVTGRLFEVTLAKDKVWEWINPWQSTGPLMQGQLPTPGFIQGNTVFKSRRYAPDFPGFAGKDLTPGDPLELLPSAAPLTVPDGSLTASKAGAGDIDVGFDATSCTSAEYNLVYGSAASISDYSLAGADCAIGLSGSHVFTPPAGNESLFFLVVGTDVSGLYESAWGSDSSGMERNLSNASGLCGATTKPVALSACP